MSIYREEGHTRTTCRKSKVHASTGEDEPRVHVNANHMSYKRRNMHDASPSQFQFDLNSVEAQSMWQSSGSTHDQASKVS